MNRGPVSRPPPRWRTPGHWSRCGLPRQRLRRGPQLTQKQPLQTMI